MVSYDERDAIAYRAGKVWEHNGQALYRCLCHATKRILEAGKGHERPRCPYCETPEGAKRYRRTHQYNGTPWRVILGEVITNDNC